MFEVQTTLFNSTRYCLKDAEAPEGSFTAGPYPYVQMATDHAPSEGQTIVEVAGDGSPVTVFREEGGIWMPVLPGIELSEQQKAAVHDALANRSLFLTGPGGTGKSATTDVIVGALTAKGKRVAVTASTGVAAVARDGTTIHSFLGTGLGQTVRDVRHLVGSPQASKAAERITQYHVIVVDEVSMLHGDYITMMDYWLKHVRHNPKPFGGMQVIFVGDFLQLPPVITEEEEIEKKYAFQSPSWVGVATHELTKSFRTDNEELVRHLNDLRYGTVTPETLDYFNARVGFDVFGGHGGAPQLFPTNREASKVNEHYFKDHVGGYREYDAIMSGLEEAWDRLIERAPADRFLELKEGCPVIIVRNNHDAGYVNGDTGTVTKFGDDFVSVELSRNGQEVYVSRDIWSLKDADNNVVCSMGQFPLRLGWAITIHKCQGMSLDKVACDLSRTFERGMAYVALSRARTYEGLYLASPLTKRQIKTSKICKRFYLEGKK